jgi:hypothetical protein
MSQPNILTTTQGHATVRPAEAGDIERLLDLSQELHEAGAMAFLPFSREKMHDLAKFYLSRPDTHYLAVAEQNGAIVGIYAGYITQYLFNFDRLAMSALVYVQPKMRGALSLRLIRAFEAWAGERGVREIGYGSSTGIDLERGIRLMERLDYAFVGHTLRKRIR